MISNHPSTSLCSRKQAVGLPNYLNDCAIVQVALLGWLLVARTQLRAAGIEAGGLLAEPQVELLLLALVYGWQAWLEACGGPWRMLPLPSRQLLQSSRRQLSMTIAALSLLCASRFTTEPRADSEVDDTGINDDNLGARLEWIDDTYSLTVAVGTILALLGALLARENSSGETTREDSDRSSKHKDA